MITITINTENAAFEGENYGPEVARILRELANILTADLLPNYAPLPLYDSNGNRVGKVITS